MRRGELIWQLRQIAEHQGQEIIVNGRGSHTKVTIGGRVMTVPRDDFVNALRARRILLYAARRVTT